jgi:type IV secretory pathway TraG/TraD family ATPase VirD4
MSSQRDLGYTASSLAIYGVLGAAAACAATVAAGWYMSGLSTYGVTAGEFLHILLWSAAPHDLAEFFHRSDLAELCTSWLAQRASWVPMAAVISAVVGGILGSWVGWMLSTPRTDVIRGRRYLTGREGLKAVQAEMAQEAQWSGPGIHIHPGIQVSRDRETRGLMVVGAIGGGKTVALKYVIESAIDRGDKVLIYDNKRDFTSEISSIVDASEVGLVAPWDKRSMRWSVAEDVRSETAARELATRLIPKEEGSGAQWATGAALILGGLIATLAQEHKRRWSWSDLRGLMQMEYADLREMALRQNQSAIGVLPEEASPTTGSYLSVLTSSAAGIVSDLAAADAEAALRGARVWNTYDWMLGAAGPRIVVMQDSSQFSTIAQALGSAVIRSARGAISQMSESKTRRIWLILDEFPQLGRVQGIDGIIDTGRSKGVCVVLGFQTKAKVDDIYGSSFADALLGNLGTQIICRSGSAEARAWASDQIGQQEVRRVMSTTSSDATIFQSKNQVTGFNQSEQIVTQPVVFDTDLAGLGLHGKGVDSILVTGSSGYVAKIWWPFAKDWKKTDEPGVPAAWTEALGSHPATDERVEPVAEVKEALSLTVTPAPYKSMDEDYSQFDDFCLDESTPSAVRQVATEAEPKPELPAEEAADPMEEAMVNHAVSEALDAVVPGAGAVVEIIDLLSESAGTDHETTALIQPSIEESERKKILVRKKTAAHEAEV